MTEPSYEQALNTLEKTFKDRIRRPTGENETKSGVLASVLPLHAQEVELLAREASRYSMPLAAVGGERREVPGEEVGNFLSTGTVEGIVVGARLRTRQADADTPFAAAFESVEDLNGAATDLFDTSVPLWHLAVLNPAMALARNLGTTHLMFGAYPRERTVEVEHRLRSVVESNRGRLLPAVDAHRAWGERYFPIRPSILPPGFPSLSREFSSMAELPQKLEQVEDSARSIALQGTIARSGEILLLTLDARKMA